MAEESLFQQARQRVMELLNMGQEVSEDDRKIAEHALQAAYQQAETAEERSEIQQLEQQLRNNQLM